jgi:hypothetical protein
MATTHDTGDRAEVAVLNDLVRLGYKILIPYGHNWRFDVAAYKDGKFMRVQVKNAVRSMKNGHERYVVRAYTGVGAKKYRYTDSDIDVIAAFIPCTEEVVYIRLQDFCGHQEMLLRKDDDPIVSGGRWAQHTIGDHRGAIK